MIGQPVPMMRPAGQVLLDIWTSWLNSPYISTCNDFPSLAPTPKTKGFGKARTLRSVIKVRVPFTRTLGMNNKLPATATKVAEWSKWDGFGFHLLDERRR